MQIEHKTIPVEHTHYRVDKLGSIWCDDCTGFGHETLGESTVMVSEKGHRRLKCDGCWKPFSEWPTVVVQVPIEIEYFQAKIF